MEPGSLEPEPLVYNGVMYLPHPNDVVQALDARTGGLIWEYRRERPKGTGGGGGVGGLQRNVAIYQDKMGSVLTTGGGLVFAGDFHRYFRAFDGETGNVLWEVPLNGPVEGYPISDAVDGRQYIAVSAGGGSVGQRHLAQLYPELKTPLASNVLMVFALGDDAPTR